MLDPWNRFGIAAQGERVLAQNVPSALSPEEALMLAAWLLRVAQPMTTTKFEDVMIVVSGF